MELITLKDVAKTVKKSERGVRRDMAAGRFGPEVIHLGRSVRVRGEELAAWIRQGCPSRERWLLLREGVCCG